MGNRIFRRRRHRRSRQWEHAHSPLVPVGGILRLSYLTVLAARVRVETFVTVPTNLAKDIFHIFGNVRPAMHAPNLTKLELERK